MSVHPWWNTHPCWSTHPYRRTHYCRSAHPCWSTPGLSHERGQGVRGRPRVVTAHHTWGRRAAAHVALGVTCPISHGDAAPTRARCTRACCPSRAAGWVSPVAEVFQGWEVCFPVSQSGQHVVKHSANKQRQKGSFLEKVWKIIKQRQSPVFILLLWLTQQKANRPKEKLNPNGKGDGIGWMESHSALCSFPKGAGRRWRSGLAPP